MRDYEGLEFKHVPSRAFFVDRGLREKDKEARMLNYLQFSGSPKIYKQTFMYIGVSNISNPSSKK